jgi:hypothetical protein
MVALAASSEERLCTQDAIDLHDLEELERRGVRFVGAGAGAAGRIVT